MLSRMMPSADTVPTLDSLNLIRASYPHLIALLTTPAVPNTIVQQATALLLLITPECP